MEAIIHTVASAKWTRFGKWRVELELVGEPKRVCWLTPAQYDYLRSAFGHTKNGYSDSLCNVIGEFTTDGHYQRCKAVLVPPKPKHFTPLINPIESITDDLLDQN